MPEQIAVGLVVPFFNEEKRFMEDYLASLAGISRLNLVLVNDGSVDLTSNYLEIFAQKHSNVEVLNLPLNLGKAEAVRYGLLHLIRNDSKYTFIGFLDCDGAVGFRDVTNMIDSLKLHSDFTSSVLGSRLDIGGRKIERNRIRFVFGRAIHFLLLTGSGLRIWDTQCGFKLFRNTQVLKVILSERFITSWLFDIEILLRFKRFGTDVNSHFEYPLLTWKEIGQSKLNSSQILTIVRDCAAILFIRWSHMKRSRRT